MAERLDVSTALRESAMPSARPALVRPRRAAPAWTPMALTWWEMTSCRSRAMLLRSAATARSMAALASRRWFSACRSSSAMWARRAVV